MERTLIISGMESKDLKLPKSVGQGLTYRWHCQSLDEFREDCTRGSGSSPLLYLDPKNLKPETQYNITLTVAKDHRSSSVNQLLLIIPNRPVVVEIQCVSNCNQNQAVLHKKLHLNAVCETCISKTSTFQWLVEGEELPGHLNHLLLDLSKFEASEELEAIVKVIDGRKNGQAGYRVKFSRINDQIGCEIKPEAGTPLDTPFEVFCTRPKNQTEEIFIKVYQDKTLIAEGAYPMVKFSLSPSTSEASEISVQLRDEYGAILDRDLGQVKLDTFEFRSTDPKAEMLDLIEGPELKSLESLKKVGDAQSAVVLFNVIVRNLKTLKEKDRQEVAERLLVASRNLQIEGDISGDKHFQILR